MFNLIFYDLKKYKVKIVEQKKWFVMDSAKPWLHEGLNQQQRQIVNFDLNFSYLLENLQLNNYDTFCGVFNYFMKSITQASIFTDGSINVCPALIKSDPVTV